MYPVTAFWPEKGMSMSCNHFRCPGYIRIALWVNCRKSSRLRRMRWIVVVFSHSFCACIFSSRPVFVVGSGIVSSTEFFIWREIKQEELFKYWTNPFQWKDALSCGEMFRFGGKKTNWGSLPCLAGWGAFPPSPPVHSNWVLSIPLLLWLL